MIIRWPRKRLGSAAGILGLDEASGPAQLEGGAEQFPAEVALPAEVKVRRGAPAGMPTACQRLSQAHGLPRLHPGGTGLQVGIDHHAAVRRENADTVCTITPFRCGSRALVLIDDFHHHAGLGRQYLIALSNGDIDGMPVLRCTVAGLPTKALADPETSLHRQWPAEGWRRGWQQQRIPRHDLESQGGLAASAGQSTDLARGELFPLGKWVAAIAVAMQRDVNRACQGIAYLRHGAATAITEDVELHGLGCV